MINIDKIILDNQKLNNITKEKGYQVIISSTHNGHGATNHTRKTITLGSYISNERNIILSHELGHIYFKRISRIFIILNEIIAWIIGYIICKVNKIDTKDFYKIMKRCLRTYIKC